MSRLSDPPQRYDLVAVMGTSPAVLTETIYALARRHRPWKPRSLHVITTTVGASFLDAFLLGHERYYRGRTIEPAAARWDAFCDEVLGEPLPFPEPLIPTLAGQLLDDIRHPGGDEALADLCYTTVADLTQEADGVPVVGSIAGGRKTMSAHLQVAFSVYARPQDRLVHILVRPDRYETDRSFFYPSGDTPDAELDLIDVPFPRLNRVLRDFLPRLEDRRDLRAMLDVLEPLNYTQAPTRVRIDVGTGTRGRSTLTFLNGSDVLATCSLTPAAMATLLVLAEHIAAGEGRVELATLHSSDARTHEQRRVVWEVCGLAAEPVPWRTAADVSGDRHVLQNGLRSVPLAADCFALETDRTTPTETSVYRWKRTPPVLELHLMKQREPHRWPFTYLSYQTDHALGG